MKLTELPYFGSYSYILNTTQGTRFVFIYFLITNYKTTKKKDLTRLHYIPYSYKLQIFKEKLDKFYGSVSIKRFDFTLHNLPSPKLVKKC